MRSNIYRHPRGIIDGTDAVDGVIANPLVWMPYRKGSGVLGHWQRLNSPLPTTPFSLDDAKELTVEEVFRLRLFKPYETPFPDELPTAEVKKEEGLAGENSPALEHQASDGDGG